MLHTEIDTARKLVVHTAAPGVLRLTDVLSTAVSSFRHPDFHPEFSVVWDLRGCQVGITLQEIIDLHPTIVARANAVRPSGKTAWVAPNAFSESIIQLLYKQHNWSAEWRTFSTVESAIVWCTLQDAGGRRHPA